MKPKIGLTKQPKVAIVHDYLNQYGGGERVVEVLHKIWPDANIYTSILDKKLMKNWLNIPFDKIKTNLISNLPFSSYLTKHYFFLYPFAFRYQNLGDSDVVISDTSYAAKFARGKKGSIHICYILTPPRFLWGYDTELVRYYHRPFDKFLHPLYTTLVPPAKRVLRNMDFSAAQRVDFFISISEEVRKRVRKHYGRDSYVIYPPVDTARFTHSREQKSEIRNQDYFLVVSRLGGYKKVNIVVEAFNRLGLSLKVVGTGPQFEYLKSIAQKNVQMLGRLPDRDVTNLIQNCKALIFPTHEDFGIVPVEAMAAGKPVIAYGKGGALETVVEGVTGEFFDKQTPSAIINEIKKFNPKKYKPEACRRQALKFSEGEFKRKIKFFVEEAYTLKRIG